MRMFVEFFAPPPASGLRRADPLILVPRGRLAGGAPKRGVTLSVGWCHPPCIRSFRSGFRSGCERFAAADTGDVVLVLQQHAHGGIGLRRVDRHAVQLDKRLCPVDGRHAGRLEQVCPAKLLHKADDLLAKRSAGLGRLAAQDVEPSSTEG